MTKRTSCCNDVSTVLNGIKQSVAGHIQGSGFIHHDDGKPATFNTTRIINRCGPQCGKNIFHSSGIIRVLKVGIFRGTQNITAIKGSYFQPGQRSLYTLLQPCHSLFGGEDVSEMFDACLAIILMTALFKNIIDLLFIIGICIEMGFRFF